MPISTNKEYIYGILSRFGLSENDVDLILIEHPEVSSNAVVSPYQCKIAMYESMSSILPGMCQNVTEGGFSVTWNIEGLKIWYSSLCREIDREDVLSAHRPKVRNRSNCW